ncbi:Protein CBG00502 [Caenorhabditis briggsae]|uniref:Protein CBG00502 n=1 Tax=Caenorhabditis briggsae TaxID=6238 RepID=A8WMT7_CAEBR|nr:Protein CBG00502 [Caenorhabditis briggsae]CAP21792.2 Protein CBG00502 [Caenorhabditis briggsae]
MFNFKDSNSSPTRSHLMSLTSERASRQAKIVNYNENAMRVVARAPLKRRQEGPKAGISSKKPAPAHRQSSDAKDPMEDLLQAQRPAGRFSAARGLLDTVRKIAKTSLASDGPKFLENRNSDDSQDPVHHSAPSTSKNSKIQIRRPILCETTFNHLKTEFRQEIRNFIETGKKMGCQEFMPFFEDGERLLDTYGNYSKTEPAVKIVQDGTHYLRELESFDGPILFKKVKGLGLEVSEEINVENLEELLEDQKYLNVICSFTQITKTMPVKKFMEFFRKDSRNDAFNVISLEVSKLKKLDREIRVPQYVERFGIINQLKTALEAEQKRQGRLLLERNSQETQKNLKFLEKIISELPTYQKFLVLSTKGSFTNAHINLSATATFFHVKIGKKVFYIAPPTPENLEIYERVEKEEMSEWIGDILWDQWIRVEISAGQTAMIPSGWIHFVWTPEDTIAVSGSYLLEKYVSRHFRITALDEHCLQNQTSGITMDHMFQGFHPVMWAYVKYILLPDIAGRSVSPEKLKIVKFFAQNLEPKKSMDRKWFEEVEQLDIQKKLKIESTDSKIIDF